MGWIRCSERLPEFAHSATPGPLTSGRRFSDPVFVLMHHREYGYETTIARCGVKDEDDWGSAAAGVPFWCDDSDRIDDPVAWMPLSELPAPVSP